MNDSIPTAECPVQPVLTPRSSRADVRNPMLAIPEVRAAYAALPLSARVALVKMLQATSRTCRANAEVAYRKHKPPMYAYWKAMGVNARHLALAGKATEFDLSISDK
ncbi:MAG: hypothetical protein K5880_09855 [Hydrogenophaga sp.]|jgi:hypothetical protein|uniref:hypothetical protein n=1 Tax=Hydrogenophaga sp. TaxID=1904254 RepID=UPI002638B6DA|nr:hypothetical protein [Hydrogenophaga sp.]MCV0438925.1 hypothetical protein [Hydrogenophaga sp.]